MKKQQNSSPFHNRVNTSPNRHIVCVDDYLTQRGGFQNNSRSPLRIQQTQYSQLNLTRKTRNKDAYQHKNHSSIFKQQPLIVYNIKVANEKHLKLEIYNDSNPFLTAKEFVKHNNLNENYIKQIESIIKHQLESYSLLSKLYNEKIVTHNKNNHSKEIQKKEPMTIRNNQISPQKASDQHYQFLSSYQQLIQLDNDTDQEYEYIAKKLDLSTQKFTLESQRKKIFEQNSQTPKNKTRSFKRPEPLESPSYENLISFAPWSKENDQISTQFLSPVDDQLTKDRNQTPKTQKKTGQYDYVTDRVIIKRLFQLLDKDQDGLISLNSSDFSRITKSLKLKIQYVLESYGQHYIQFEYEDFYRALSSDAAEYFDFLKNLSDFFNEKYILVTVNK